MTQERKLTMTKKKRTRNDKKKKTECPLTLPSPRFNGERIKVRGGVSVRQVTWRTDVCSGIGISIIAAVASLPCLTFG